MKIKRLCSLLLAAALLCNAASVLPQKASAPLVASAADGRLYNQWDEKWKEVTFTKYSRSGNSLYTSACGIFSFCNAMYALNSRRIDVVELATWAVEIGALRPGAGGTYRDILYKHIEEKWGQEYGFTLGAQQLGTVRDEAFIEHLKNGGVAVLYVPGHFIAVTGYDELYQLYHVIESAVSEKRGLEPDSWVSADKLTNGGTDGTWYVLISNIKAPEYAKVSLPRTLWGIGEEMRYTLDSNTRNSYTVHFYDGDEKTPRAELSVSDQQSHSSTQHLDCFINYPGDFTVDITGSNEFGTVQSERIGLRVYDESITGASFKLLSSGAETGKPVKFRTAGSPAAGYTLKAKDAEGKTVYEQYIADMLDGDTLTSSDAEWVPEYPGEYTCTATLHNIFGNITPVAVKLTVDGNVGFSFDAAGGTLAEQTPHQAAYKGRYGELPVPVRDNHRFDGWFTEAEGGTEVTADTVMNQTHPHTLYAHWTKVLETGDINGDHAVDPADAQLVLTEYVNVMSGQAPVFDAAQNKAGDINKDGAVSIDDAQNILKYYVENTVAGRNITWDELLIKPEVTTTTVTTTVTTTTTTTATTVTTNGQSTTKPVQTTAKPGTLPQSTTTAMPVSSSAKAATAGTTTSTTAKPVTTTVRPAETTVQKPVTTAKPAFTTAATANTASIVTTVSS